MFTRTLPKTAPKSIQKMREAPFLLVPAGCSFKGVSSMNVLILAAGYATRLSPLTLNKAKPLLTVAGKPMIEWVLDNLAPVPGIDSVYVVTNNKFAADFQAWADDYVRRQPKLHFKIVNDGSTSDSDK